MRICNLCSISMTFALGLHITASDINRPRVQMYLNILIWPWSGWFFQLIFPRALQSFLLQKQCWNVTAKNRVILNCRISCTSFATHPSHPRGGQYMMWQLVIPALFLKSRQHLSNYLSGLLNEEPEAKSTHFMVTFSVPVVSRKCYKMN